MGTIISGPKKPYSKRVYIAHIYVNYHTEKVVRYDKIVPTYVNKSLLMVVVQRSLFIFIIDKIIIICKYFISFTIFKNKTKIKFF